MKEKNAFTLAEVLITLMILGVIAILTIPNVIKKADDLHTVFAVKKMYSTIDNALKKIMTEEGATDLYDLEWPVPTGGESTAYIDPNSNFLYTKLKKHLKIEKDTNIRSGKLLNGVTIIIGITRPYRKTPDASGKACYDYLGTISFDINGSQPPNKWGYDKFMFEIVPTGLNVPFYPGGHYKICSGHSMAKANCCIRQPDGNMTGTGSWLSSCSTWIMVHGNVDYKYRTVEQGIYTFFQ